MTSKPESPSAQRSLAIAELVLAGALWGFGFIATSWALTELSPLWVTGLRALLAVTVGGSFLLIVPSMRRHIQIAQFKLAFWPGFFLALTLLLQTWGLKYTTATKSGFITVLYVLLVPILESVLLGRKLHRWHWLFVSTSLVGVVMICGLSESQDDRLNWGDGLTLLCAIAASFQIFWFSKIQNKIGGAFHFNIYQTIWAGALPLVLALVLEPLPKVIEGKALSGILALSLGSTLIAFALQVRAQKKISASFASLLFLLESPFAAIFAVIFLHEKLSPAQWIGGAVILGSVALSSLIETSP